MTDIIILLDFLNFCYRGNVKFKSNKDPKINQDYVVVYNFVRNFRQLVEQFKPTRVFCCLEGGRSFRKDISSQYKANRIIKYAAKQSKTQANFYRQVDDILDVLQHLPNIITAKADGFEGDDIIATLADDLKNENVIAVSNDADITQLLQKGYDRFAIYNPYISKFVKNPPYHQLTFRLLTADVSDNIAGLMSKKQGIELASDSNLLKKFLSSEENRSNFNLNRKLIELRPIHSDKIQFTQSTKDYAALRRKFIKMKFNSIIQQDSWKKFIGTFERTA